MGNTPSNQGNQSSSSQQQQGGSDKSRSAPKEKEKESKSGSPSKSSVHKSMRHKKKSLELPDFDKLSLSALRPHQPSSPIPIPGQRVTHSNSSIATRGVVYTGVPYVASNRTVAGPQATQQTAPAPTDGQDQSQASDRPEYQKKLIRSTNRSGLPGAADFSEDALDGIVSETRPVKIIWRIKDGEADVQLARANHDAWTGRTHLDHDPSNPDLLTTTVRFPPGTHHIKFVVKDQFVLSSEHPTAVDDDGELANYVAVPLSSPVMQPRESHSADFWKMSAREAAVWTDTIPPGLIAAARDEEAWLTAVEPPNHNPLPAPPIPPAPQLPRHLDRLILNQRSSGHSRGPDGRRTPASRSNRSSATRMGSIPQPPGPPTPPVTGAPSPTSTLAEPSHVDDSSVLPVPSHVVLHHLGTSAIRNGVLAVADTVRYKKKFITTIYYKPTGSPGPSPAAPAS